MPDVFTKRKRSEVMSLIRGRGNKDTEVALAKLLRAHGVSGWRRQQRVRIQGKKRRADPDLKIGVKSTRPIKVAVDFIFPKKRVAIFVDGCFWHGCPMHSSPAKWLKKSSMGAGVHGSGFAVQGSGLAAKGKVRGRETGAQRKTTTDRGTTEILRRVPQFCGISGQSPSTQDDRKGGRTGKEFWAQKMAGNMARDLLVNRELRRAGWKVVRIWEHELGRRNQQIMERIRRVIK